MGKRNPIVVVIQNLEPDQGMRGKHLALSMIMNGDSKVLDVS